MKKSLVEWWHTDCKYCRKARMIFLWLILMIVADAMWFHLLIK
jgi:hypothetical protein